MVSTHITKVINLAIPVIAAGFISACQTVPEKYSNEKALDVLNAQNKTWQSQNEEGKFIDTGWLAQFDDSRLNKYVDTALKNNFSLKRNESQLLATIANTRVIKNAIWPTLDFNLRENRNEQENTAGQVETSTSFNGNLAISWELDIWQKLTSRKRAAILDIRSNKLQFDAAKLSLAATVARTWFSINEQKLRLNIENERLKTLESTLEIVEEQYTSGQQSALNVYSNRIDLINQQANVSTLENSLSNALRDFKVILGEYPEVDLDFDAKLPSITKAIPAGLPAELIARRPDIKAALYQWQSKVYETKAANRDRLPSFSLTASYGASSNDLKTLDEKTLLWNLVNNISLPLFKRGQLKSQADAAKLLQEAEFKSYLDTLLTSFNEVETALSTEKSVLERTSLTQELVTLANSGYELALEQYRSGIISYTDLLNSQRRLFDAKSRMVSLQNTVLQNRISLNLALGGDFYAPKKADNKK